MSRPILDQGFFLKSQCHHKVQEVSCEKYPGIVNLKGQAVRRIFWVFCRNWFLMSDTGSRQLPASLYVESPTPRITDMRSRRLPASPIRSVGYWIFLKKSLRIDDTESHRLPTPVIRWVADSPYHWVGESLTPRISDTGSRYSKKKLICCRFSKLLTANHAFKGLFWQKISQGCNVLSH